MSLIYPEPAQILLASLLQIGHNIELMPYVIPLQDALDDILALEVAPIEATRLRQGQCLQTSHSEVADVVLVMCEKTPQALAKIKEGKIVPLRVFNITNKEI